MKTYEAILSGPFNLYNVGLAILTAIGLGVVILQIVRALPGRALPRGVVRGALDAAGVGLLGLGALVFAALTFAAPNEDIPPWGVFFLLPAAFLASLAVLGVLRPLRAGAILVIGAFLAVVFVAVLGTIADTIDPRWAADQVDLGFSAATTLLFGLPALVTGLLLLVAGAPWIEPGLPRGNPQTGPPHPA